MNEPARENMDLQPEPLAVRLVVGAKMIGLSRSTVYELIEEGAIESIKVGRARLIPVDSLRAFLASKPRV